MKSNPILIRLAVAALAAFTLGSTALAGPGPMPIYMMMHGKMHTVTPMAKDAVCKNGCKVGMDGMMTMPKGKPAMLKEGDMVTSEGVRMPAAMRKGRGQ